MRTPGELQRSTSIERPMPAVAVLPFVDMSEEQNQAYFAHGLSEEILNLLAQSSSMRVIARTSSFSFKDRRELVATIAQKLDVTHVLEGKYFGAELATLGAGSLRPLQSAADSLPSPPPRRRHDPRYGP